MWLWVIAMILVAVALPALYARRLARNRHLQKHSPDHEAKLTALSEWLSEPRIVGILVQFTPMTAEGVDALYRSLGAMDEESLDNVLKERILFKREVRRIICHHVELTHGVPRYETMRALLEWAGKEA